MRKKRHDRVGRPPKLNRPVVARNLVTGEERTYSNYRETAAAIKGNRGVIFMCLAGDRHSHHGFEFRYADAEYL